MKLSQVHASERTRPLPAKIERSAMRTTQALCLFILILSAFMRLTALGSMADMLSYDEAWHGVDALSIIAHPRLTPFFPNNFGRESGWVYWLVPYILAFGATPFALHLASAFISLLTVAFVCRLGREVLGNSGGMWSAAILSVFYWHVHLSHLALRANLYLLVSTWATAWLYYAYRNHATPYWIWGGIVSGMAAYTYFASFSWLAYVWLLLLITGLYTHRKQKGALLALGFSLLVAAPLFYYLWQNPNVFFMRPSTVVVTDSHDIIRNIYRWLHAWFQQGDNNHQFNWAGQPIFTPSYLGGLCIVGILTLWSNPKQRHIGAILIVWLTVACIPSLVSDYAPHFLRASGMIVPLSLIMAQGGDWLSHRLQNITTLPALLLLPVLIIPTSVQTFVNFHIHWLHQDDTFIMMEQHVNQATTYINNIQPKENVVYFSPFSVSHPVIAFRSHELYPRRVAAFDSHQCLVLSNQPAIYVSLTMYEPNFQRELAQYAKVTPLYTEPQSRYTIFSTSSLPTERQLLARFGNEMDIYLMHPIISSTTPGSVLSVTLGIHPLHTLDFSPSVFIHLYSDPTPYEGGTLWAQGDSQVCPSYPAFLWQPDETIVQKFEIPLPPTIPPGQYTIAIGVYHFPEGERLLITSSNEEPNPWRYYAISKITILPVSSH